MTYRSSRFLKKALFTALNARDRIYTINEEIHPEFTTKINLIKQTTQTF